MSGLRWNTGDERGEAWRSERVRGVTAGVSLVVALVMLVAAVATYGGATVATADLSMLDAQRKAELKAIDEHHEGALRNLSAAHDQKKLKLKAQHDADVAAIDRAAELRLAELDAAKAAALAAAEAARAEGHRQVDAQKPPEKATIDKFFSDVLTSLGPEAKPPTKTALDAAKRTLEAKRSSELSALASAHGAAEVALDVSGKAAVAALEAEARQLDADYAATRAAVDAALSSTKSNLNAALNARLATIDTDTTLIKVRHAQERITLAQLHAAQTQAAATSSGAVRSALDDKQHVEEDELKDLQAGELAAQAAAKKASEADTAVAVDMAEAARNADAAANKVTYETNRSAIEAAISTTKSERSTALHALEDRNGASYAALKATYDGAVNSIAKGHTAVRAAWTSRLGRLDSDVLRRHGDLDERTDVDKNKTTRQTKDRAEAALRKASDDKRGRGRRLDREYDAENHDIKATKAAAERDRDRQKRLVESKYFSLKIRAVAFLDQPGAFESVDAAFDPARDPGSLWNVARRIGVGELNPDVTGAGIDVALIDTGVVDVPGLAEASIEIGPDFSFEDVVPDLRARDTNGHGTHLAGIINGRDAAWAAGDRERRPNRFLGIAPDAKVVSVKAGAADGSVDVTQIIAAINWVIANRNTEGRNIRVLNLAFGTDGVQDYRLDPLAHAVERAWHAGIVVVVAAGNDGWAASRLTNPAQDPFVIAVAASQAVDGKENMPADYSNGSADERMPDVAAPGRSIVSLRNPGSFSDETNEAGRTGDRFVRGSGTSQAAAVTSGAVALLLSKRPNLTPDQVKHLLMTEASDAGTDIDLAGAGYLRVDRALKASIPFTRQSWERSTGAGTMDGARGTVRVVADGVVLEGDLDIFGSDWSGSKWSQDSWTGSKWSGSEWSGSKWSGSRWSADMWAGSKWSGSKWSSEFWTGSKWSGSKWSADGWSGSKWSGSKWSAGGWFGIGWNDGPAVENVVGTESASPEAFVEAAAGTPTP